MAKKQEEEDDKVVIIPKSKRIVEIESMIEYFMNSTPNLPLNKIKFKRVIHPKFTSDEERRVYFIEEIKRCKYGYKGMCGKMYFFYNYVYMQNLKGKIRPEYRVADNEWFRTLTEAEESNEWGIVCVKRRRCGMSWKEAADIIYDMIFKTFYNVGANSKTERDSIVFFRKMLFIYENLPEEMKANIGSKSGMHVEFFRVDKDNAGNKVRRGNQNDLMIVPPTDSAYEGMMLNKWVCDEAGKIRNLTQMWSYTEDCLMQETKRIGTPVLFGTSGDITKDGQGLCEKWDNADIYKLRRFFFAGWMGLAVDEFGNDRKEDAIRWILYTRKDKEALDKKQYIDFIQRYPLTPSEAFSKYSSEGLGDPVTLNNHMESLRLNPPIERRGSFHFDEDWNVKFIPAKFGPVIIYEDPSDNPNDTYIGGVDPADHDNVTNTTSDLSLHILKESDGLSPARLVCEYVDRPNNLTEYYNQGICIAIYYNDCKLLIEDNRYRMISHFEYMGFKSLLHYSPPTLNRLFKTKPTKLGVRMSNDVKTYMEGIIDEYLENSTEDIPSIQLIQEFMEYGSRNTDRVMSFGIALMLARSRERRIVNKRNAAISARITPSFSYKRDSSGNVRKIEA
jgi:hypothetical protein